MAAAHVEHVVNHVSSGREIGDHREAIGLIRSRGLCDFLRRNHGLNRRCLGVQSAGGARNFDTRIYRREFELKMQNRGRPGGHVGLLFHRLQTGRGDRNPIRAFRKTVQLKLAIGAGQHGSGLGRIAPANRNLGAGNRAMLGIVNHALQSAGSGRQERG